MFDIRLDFQFCELVKWVKGGLERCCFFKGIWLLEVEMKQEFRFGIMKVLEIIQLFGLLGVGVIQSGIVLEG